ncbi:MAG TPA: hypothetical protein VHO06_15805 [Polyangia bacterium]|nr:hypothetical protein [Polyangia bacterium]
MNGDLIYSVEVEVIAFPDEEAGEYTRKPTIVRYCDICRRWGAVGSTHMCWRNWRPRLSDLLIEMTRDGRQP